MVNFNKFTKRWEDNTTNQIGYTKTELMANIKRYNLQLPRHEWFSNQYVLKRL